MRMFAMWRMLFFGSMLTIAAAPGCDQKKIEDAVSTGLQQAQDKVEQTVETVKQEVNLVGSMDLSTTPPLSAKACYVKFVVPGDGRPNVLQMASYKEADLERFPSVFLQARVQTATLTDLAGQTVNADLFAQSGQSGPLWFSHDESPVSLSVTSVDDKSMVCELSGAQLINADTGETATVSGKFIGLLD